MLDHERRVCTDKLDDYLFHVHACHSCVHSFNKHKIGNYKMNSTLDNIGHTSSDFTHSDGGTNTSSHRINPTTQSQQIQRFILLPDCILSVYLCTFIVSLLDGFLEFCLLLRFLLLTLFTLSLQLLGCELRD